MRRCGARFLIALGGPDKQADLPYPVALLRAGRQGHETAAPPSSVMNSRRLMGLLDAIRRVTVPPHEYPGEG